MENLRVLEGSEVFFRGLQHLIPGSNPGGTFRKPWKISRAYFYYKILAEDREARLPEKSTASFPDAVRQIRNFFL